MLSRPQSVGHLSLPRQRTIGARRGVSRALRKDKQPRRCILPTSVSDIPASAQAAPLSRLTVSTMAPNQATDAIAAVTECTTAAGRRRVFVTGAAGFIGFHTAKALLERGDDVVIVDEMNDYYDVKLKQSNLDWLTTTYGDRVTVYIGDLCDEQLVLRVLKETKPDAMVHLAARAGVRPSIDNPLMYIQANVVATMVLLDACREFGIKKFVYASSSSVYGGSMKESFSEEDIVDFPVSPYAATKKSCELLAHTYHHLYGMDTIGLRFFTVYGPRGRPDMAPFKFMDRIARDVAIDQYGDGSSQRDYTFIDDIVQGVLLSLDRGQGCEVFNLGRGTPVLLTDFIGIIEGLVGKKAKINILPDQPGDVPRTSADISKAERMLGYKPTTPLEQGLAKTWEWYSEFYNAEPATSS